MFSRIIAITLLLLPLLAASSAFGMPLQKQKLYAQNALTGEIKIESEKKKESPYRRSVNETMNYLQEIQNIIRENTEGANRVEIRPLKKFYSSTFDYLNALYFYCILRSGTCSFILDALLEGDVINAKLQGKAFCPVMTSFWKRWLGNQMERRVGYRLKVGLFQKAERFKKEKRPRYIRCKDTVAEKIVSPAEGKNFFTERYTKEPDILKSVDKLSKFVTLLKKKEINVYHTAGLKG